MTRRVHPEDIVYMADRFASAERRAAYADESSTGEFLGRTSMEWSYLISVRRNALRRLAYALHKQGKGNQS